MKLQAYYTVYIYTQDGQMLTKSASAEHSDGDVRKGWLTVPAQCSQNGWHVVDRLSQTRVILILSLLLSLYISIYLK